MAIIMASHLLWLRCGTEAVCYSADGPGYGVQARLLATHSRTELKPESELQYIGYHWMETREGTYFCRYPPGFSLIQACAFAIAGPTAGLWVASLLATSLLALVYLLARAFVGPLWGLTAAAVMAVNGIANTQALENTAHNASAFMLLLGLYLLLVFARTQRLFHGLAAGIILGALPAIRYGEAMVLPGLAVYVWCRRRDRALCWPLLLGATPPLAALAYRNAAVFGAPWRTGYSLTGEQTAFSLHNFRSHFLAYVWGLQSDSLLWFFPLGVAGLAYLLVHSDKNWRNLGLLFSVIVSSLTATYAAFYFSVAPIQRFLVPVLPLLIVAAIVFLSRLATIPGMAPVVVALIVGQLGLSWAAANASMRREKESIKAVAEIHRLVLSRVPSGQVLAASWRYLESLDYVGHWRLADEAYLVGHEPLNRVPGSGLADAPIHPDSRQPGKNRLQRSALGQLPLQLRPTAYAAALCEWARTGSFYWLGQPYVEELLRSNLAGRLGIERIAELRFTNPVPLLGKGAKRAASAPPDGGVEPLTSMLQVPDQNVKAPDLVLLRIDQR